MTVERNALCPCGSGLKYKKCCLNSGLTTSAHHGLTPSQLVERRVEAFRQHDFGFIFDTYHPDSNFRLQFPSRAEYIHYGKTTLNSDYTIRDYRILQQRELDRDHAQVLFLLTVAYQSQVQEYFELSEFNVVQGQWYYLQSHRLERHEFEGAIHEMTCEQMEQRGICF